MTTTKPHGYWQRNAQLLRDQAKTMTCKELATAHHATPKQIRHQLHLLKTTCKSAKLARHEHLSELCKKQLSVRQIAELEGKTTSAIYQELKLHGLSTINTQLRWTEAAIAELTEQAKTRTAAELAALRQLELKYMYKLLRRFGIKTRPHRTVVPRSPKPKAAPKQRTAAAYTPVLRKPAQPAYALPQPKPQPEIIWPAHVQVQRIATCIPANAPLCTSTSRKPLVLGKNFCNGPRAI